VAARPASHAASTRRALGAEPSAARATRPNADCPTAAVYAHALVVGLHLDPAAGRAPENVLADLVVNEDGHAERHGRDPPGPTEGVHPQALV